VLPIAVGNQVAAKPPTMTENGVDWILAEVTAQVPAENKYRVVDAEVGEDGTRAEYVLSPHCVRPLREVSKEVVLSVGQVVLALYPGTTCFYRAVIVHSLSKSETGAWTCSVQFDDDEEKTQVVDARMVLPEPAAPA